MKTSLDPTTFYSTDFPRRLIGDYAYGNRRIEYAINFLVQSLPKDVSQILDIGCGIGWTSQEMNKARPQSKVIGVDLSPTHINLAQQLFGKSSSLRFSTQNVLDWDAKDMPKIDAIVMVDVYEHIPREGRKDLHAKFKEFFRGSGVVLLTFPSAEYQQYLRDHRPEGLQPVDEDVTREDMERLASDVGGRLVSFKPLTIWNNPIPNDYVHACIAVGDVAIPGDSPNSQWQPAPQEERLAHIVSSLGLRPTPWQHMLPVKAGKTVCVVVPQKNAPSETFIKAHLEELPCSVRALFGSYPNYQNDAGKHLIGQRTIEKATHSIARRMGNDLEAKRIVSYLREIRADAVLAEYGPTAIPLIGPCRLAQIPLIVHFHGYDASKKDCLKENQAGYRHLFTEATKIICVSQQMKQKLIQLGAPEDKLVVNPCGANTQRFVKSDPSLTKPVFLSVGRFVEKKAPHLTILAFQRVLQEIPDARLIMVGDGPLFGVCQRMIQGLDLQDSIDLMGTRDATEVAQLMQHARCFVQHSVEAADGDSEGTPVSVLEAGASGLPVVATHHGGIIDVIVDKRTGFLVAEGDIKGMAKYMTLLGKDPKLAAEMGSAAHEHIEANFTLSISLARLWQTLESSFGRFK